MVLTLEVRRGSGAVAGVMARRAGTGPAGVVTASNRAVGSGWVAGVVIGKNENDLAFGFSLRKDGDSHVWKQSAYKAEGFAKVKRAFGLGLMGLIGSRIWSKWSLQFKNQALTFCYSLMRDAYGGIYSVGDALIEYADSHIDNA